MKGIQQGIKLFLICFSLGAQATTPITAAIASPDPEATQIGMQILGQGKSVQEAAKGMLKTLNARLPNQQHTQCLFRENKSPFVIKKINLEKALSDNSPSVQQFAYHRLKKITALSPQSHNIKLALGILEDFEMDPLSLGDINHLVAETLTAVGCKTSKKNSAEELRESIKMNKATSSKSRGCRNIATIERSSVHFAVLDQKGNAIVCASSPIIFETEIGIGLVATNGDLGDPSIELLALLDAEKGTQAQSWAAVPRFYSQISPDAIYFESSAFSDHEQNALKLRGHILKPVSGTYGDLEAIYWDQKTNQVTAASDPRGSGLALVKQINP